MYKRKPTIKEYLVMHDIPQYEFADWIKADCGYSNGIINGKQAFGVSTFLMLPADIKENCSISNLKLSNELAHKLMDKRMKKMWATLNPKQGCELTEDLLVELHRISDGYYDATFTLEE